MVDGETKNEMSLPKITQCHLLPFTSLLHRIKYAIFHPFANEAVTCIMTALTGRSTNDTCQCTPQFSKNVFLEMTKPP